MEKRWLPMGISLFGISCLMLGDDWTVEAISDFFGICAVISFYVVVILLFFDYGSKKSEKKILGINTILSGMLAAYMIKNISMIHAVPIYFVVVYAMVSPFIGSIIFVRQCMKDFNKDSE